MEGDRRESEGRMGEGRERREPLQSVNPPMANRLQRTC